MYLKSIEIIGFKSFANKTLIELKPGITAIVGPNGCGKSNVSDAVRWVLGEQRAKALRGSNMQDIIFNGTDDAKPMGMAEVSLTLTDCSKSLNTEYDEVCITRRVYRSNESGYFINKKACRLKDIQRLFMDTGIGTDSYSVLEQGKIDQILSAKPEDRRTVFEEASGITKFKTDKKESLRKLDQTEANLIRLEDVIKEVKRQIISLQRQAGKAKRYKELKKEMKSLDLYLSSKQLNILKLKIENLTNKLHENEKEIENLQITIKNEEDNSRIARTGLTEKENFITLSMEKISQTKSEFENSKQLII
ncbi:MAG: AAA family ATPase, partial [Verrucomicrobiota bacterium]|nr:AAA family ATPase [Verrucomicrobiota bacterium]